LQRSVGLRGTLVKDGRALRRGPPPACNAATRWPSRHPVYPAINVNDSVTKSRSTTLRLAAMSLRRSAIKRAMDVIWPQGAVVCGYGDVGQGLRRLAACLRARVGAPDRPDLLPCSGVEGFEVNTGITLGRADLYSATTTGNKDIIRIEHLSAMKDQACLQHRHSTTRSRSRRCRFAGVQHGNTSRRVTSTSSRTAKRSSAGRRPPGQPGCATGHPRFVMSTRSPIDRFPADRRGANKGPLREQGDRCRRSLDEDWHACTWKKIGVKRPP